MPDVDVDIKKLEKDIMVGAVSPISGRATAAGGPVVANHDKHGGPVVVRRDAELKKKAARCPLHLNLPVGLMHMAWAMYDGFKKYTMCSWRNPEVSVTATSMIAAAERHLQLLKDGENYASSPGDSGAHHAGHVMACMQIYLDCEAANKPGFDDRKKGPAPDVWSWRPERVDA